MRLARQRGGSQLFDEHIAEPVAQFHDRLADFVHPDLVNHHCDERMCASLAESENDDSGVIAADFSKYRFAVFIEPVGVYAPIGIVVG